MMPALQCVHPEALALALPAAVAWWLWCARGSGRWWRAAALACLVLAAIQPEMAWGRGGSDVVLVLDRSSSMGDEARRYQDELVRHASEQRRAGDRLAVVVFGEQAGVVQGPQETALPRLSEMPVSPGASELAAGLDLAAGLVAPGRSARVLVHSDGEHTGIDPRLAASRLAASAIPIDGLPVLRPAAADAAILDLELPNHLRLGESFLGAMRFVCDASGNRGWRIRRGEHQVASGTVALSAGEAVTVTFADRPSRPGLVSYTVELDGDDTNDRLLLNNTARGALRVEGGERVLVVGGDGTPGNVARALGAAGLNVVSRAEGPLRFEDLLGYQVLVLQAVPADRLGADGMEAIARWVEHLGGGLVLTGGRRSFGSGGYHKSPVERVLPVSMELRDEHRKLAVSMAITLDRSGSMAATVAGGRTKMDLANEGAAAAIEMLSPRDQVAVHAVDSAPHVVVPMTALSDPGPLVRRVLGIESEGGGIYVYQALLAAGAELLKTSTGTRHLVLFADAADAEEPGDYVRLLAEYAQAGITVSVIGMGTEADSDADFLKDVARRGGGRISFADRPEDIPRLFAQETVLVARSSWIAEPVSLAPQPLLNVELGQDPALGQGWPTVGGYNLTYPRDRASVLALAPGDPQAPAVATWRIGTGRSVAVPIDVDDANDPALAAWKGYAPLLASLVRWAAGGDEQAPGALFAERAGRSVTLRLELDPAKRADWPGTAPDLVLNKDQEVGLPKRLAMEPIDEGVYEAVLRLDDEHALLPSVAVAGSAIIGPALALPYTPEAEPRFGRVPGLDTLAALARDTRGRIRKDLLDLFRNPPSPGDLDSLSTPLVILALLLVTAEIAVRRLQLAFPDLRLPTWLRLRRRPAVATAAAKPSPLATVAAARPAPAPSPKPGATGASPTAPPPAAPPKDGGLHEALRQMKNRRK